MDDKHVLCFAVSLPIDVSQQGSYQLPLTESPIRRASSENLGDIIHSNIHSSAYPMRSQYHPMRKCLGTADAGRQGILHLPRYQHIFNCISENICARQE